ncbi:PepSY domain-containing protein [Methylobacterium oxalidis]|uniref:PepSY domain-containing protein n=1 Tax=Methylobacterium oxalidis TaxID=944322 RepID=UPI0033156BD5
MRSLKRAKRWLVLGHRWLGIVTGLFFAVWLLSGLVMLYVPFPSLTEAERLARLPPLALDQVGVGPAEALRAAALSAPPRSFGLEMRGDAPVYRIVSTAGVPATVSAVTGAGLPPVAPDAALAWVRGQTGRAAGVRTLERDQWTVAGRYDPLRPFHVVALGDGAGTELYVSGVTGAVVLDTTARERFWNWLGAVPHWLYPTPLRARPDLWRDVVLWVSGIGVAGALSGLALGIWRLRPRRRYPSGGATPYRGIARLHHLFGVVGGLGLLTFVASGWLSMNPNRWFSGPSPDAAMQQGYAGGAPLPGLGEIRAAAAGTVALRFVAAGGTARLVALDAAGGRRVTPGVDEAAIRAAAPGLMPGAQLARFERLAAYDAYWYAHHDAKPLPVFRLAFDDSAATWFHVDATTGELLDRLDRSGRVHRWLFAALHRLDLPVLIGNRPAWDVAQWLLNGLGLVVALTGVVMGWRRLRRPRPAFGTRG